jgi:ribosomal protein L39E
VDKLDRTMAASPARCKPLVDRIAVLVHVDAGTSFVDAFHLPSSARRTAGGVASTKRLTCVLSNQWARQNVVPADAKVRLIASSKHHSELPTFARLRRGVESNHFRHSWRPQGHDHYS